MTAEKGSAAGMESLVGSSNTVGVAMASDAGGIIVLMAGSAVLRIPPGGLTVSGLPDREGMIQRDAQLSEMAIVTELFSLMAGCAIERFNRRIETMGKTIIQFMNGTADIIPAMALYAVVLLLMAGEAPVFVTSGIYPMRLPPVGLVIITAGRICHMTERTALRILLTPVTGVAQVFIVFDRLSRHADRVKITMAVVALDAGINMNYMTEFERGLEMVGRGRVVR